MQKDPPWWKIAITVPILLFIIFFIIGPVVVFLAVLLQRFVLSLAPPWDETRYWEGAKGYAAAGILVYAILVIRMVLMGDNSQLDLSLTHGADRLLIEGLDLSALALLHKWTAGLLFLPTLALLQERTAPRTDRAPLRILTPSERQLLLEREAEQKQHAEAGREATQAQAKTGQKTKSLAQTRAQRPPVTSREPALAKRQTEEPDTPLDPTGNLTSWLKSCGPHDRKSTARSN